MTDRCAKARAAKSAFGWRPYTHAMRTVAERLRKGPATSLELCKGTGLSSGQVFDRLAQAERQGHVASELMPGSYGKGTKGGRARVRVWRVVDAR